MRRTATFLVALVAAASLQSTAFGASRYCGTGTSNTLTRTTSYVGSAWNRPGWRLMQTRSHLSATARYYVCAAPRR